MMMMIAGGVSLEETSGMGTVVYAPTKSATLAWNRSLYPLCVHNKGFIVLSRWRDEQCLQNTQHEP